MRVLVTGAAGFIGRWVVGELLERGHTVLPIDNLAEGDEANLEAFAGQPGFLPFEVGDVRDAASCRRWINERAMVVQSEWMTVSRSLRERRHGMCRAR